MKALNISQTVVFNEGKEISSIHRFLKVFIMSRCWNLWQHFSISIEIITWFFFLFNLLMWSSYINILFFQFDPLQKQSLLQWEAKLGHGSSFSSVLNCPTPLFFFPVCHSTWKCSCRKFFRTYNKETFTQRSGFASVSPGYSLNQQSDTYLS